MRSRVLRVTFELDAAGYEGKNDVETMQLVRQHAQDLIFQNAEEQQQMLLLESLASLSKEQDDRVLVLREHYHAALRRNIKEINAAAKTATYEMVDFVSHRANVQ